MIAMPIIYDYMLCTLHSTMAWQAENLDRYQAGPVVF